MVFVCVPHCRVIGHRLSRPKGNYGERSESELFVAKDAGMTRSQSSHAQEEIESHDQISSPTDFCLRYASFDDRQKWESKGAPVVLVNVQFTPRK
jgi:hypothetical protein